MASISALATASAVAITPASVAAPDSDPTPASASASASVLASASASAPALASAPVSDDEPDEEAPVSEDDDEATAAGDGTRRSRRRKVSQYVTDQYYGLEPAQFLAIRRAWDAQAIKKYPEKIRDKDLRGVMRSFGWNPTDTEMTDMLVTLDPGNTEKIEFHKFMKIMAKKMKEVDYEAEIKEAFGVLDPEGNGFITVKEFEYIMSHAVEGLPENELDEMMADLDGNGDGQIDYEELANIARFGRAFELHEFKSSKDT